MNRPSRTPPPFWDFMSGLVVVPILHVFFIVVSVFLMLIIPFSLILALGIGLSQFLYLIPLIVSCQRQGRLEAIKGILVASFLTILVNSACNTVIAPSDYLWANSIRDDTIVLTGLSMFTLIVTAFYSLKPRSRPK